jgi:hypothetical protein
MGCFPVKLAVIWYKSIFENTGGYSVICLHITDGYHIARDSEDEDFSA